jgi:hypothetical protein
MAITLDGSNVITGGLINSGTAQATTSGTAITFTGIPSTAKRITVMFNGVSTSGISIVQVQVGSGSVTTTGYVSYAVQLTNASSISGQAVTTGFHIQNQNASAARNGQMVLTTLGSNIWTASHALGDSAAAAVLTGGGAITLSGILDRVVLTTVNGTDTFDAGSVNIFWE